MIKVPRHNLLSGKAGFTLIEILISVVILAVGILGVTAIQSASLNGEILSRNTDSALNIASDATDRMTSNSENISDYIGGAYGTPFTVTLDMNDTNPSDNSERPTGAIASQDYDDLYNQMLDMDLSNAVLAVSLQNDTPVSGVDTATATVTWTYKGDTKQCVVTNIIKRN